MTTTVNLRKMLHRKSPEYLNPNRAGNTVAGSFIVSDKSNLIPTHDIAYYVAGVSAIWNYNADEDGWQQLPNSGIAGTFAVGSCGEFRALSAMGGVFTNTALAGGTTTKLNTNQTIVRNLAGCEIRVIAGSGIGYSGIIKGNTLGANAIIETTTASGVAFDATTQYQVYGGSLWFFNAGTVAVGFAVYDRATNVWTQRSVTGLPTAWGTDAQLVSTGGRASNNGSGFVNGTATAGAASTITTNKTFLLNQWANMQVRIISGTGAGQIRKIASNTAGASGILTVSAAWTTNPDATSVYRIEGDDDAFFLLGNNAVTMYKYIVSTNTWSTLAPTAARAAALGTGGTADWIDAVQNTQWTDETYGNHYTTVLVRQNGRYIYSFRGTAGNVLDVYDIAANTWISGISYGNQTEVFGGGSCSVDMNGQIYIQKDVTGVIFKFDVALNALNMFTVNPIPQGSVLNGDKMFITTYNDGATNINWLYTLGHTRSELTRFLVV